MTMNTKSALPRLVLLALMLPAVSRAQWLYHTNYGALTIGRYLGADSTVIVPESIGGLPVTGIGLRAFSFNENLTDITIPESVTNIEGSAFRGCTRLTSVRLPHSVTRIAGAMFSGCRALAGITIHNQVTSIGYSAFWGCSGLTNVTIPSSLDSIGNSAFGYCTCLAIIDIPASVTRIGDAPLSGCASLMEIRVDPMNPKYSGQDGVLFNKTQTALIQYPGAKGAGYIIPDRVTTIGSGAFSGCSKLNSVIIPQSVTSIGNAAFEGCASLRSVTIPASVSTLGNSAFRGCTTLGSVYFNGNPPDQVFDLFSSQSTVTAYHLPGRPGWSTTFAGKPTALWIPIRPTLPSIPADYPLRLLTSSPAPPKIQIQRSDDLQHWEDWQTISRDKGPSELQDPDAETMPYRFYRGIEQ